MFTYIFFIFIYFLSLYCLFLGTSASMVDVNSGPRPESGHSLTIQADMNDGRGISPGGKSDANFYMEMMVCNKTIRYFINSCSWLTFR